MISFDQETLGETLGAQEKNKSVMFNVFFPVKKPYANRLYVFGSFNHWKRAEALELKPQSDGYWSAEVKGLLAGLYEYRFIIFRSGHEPKTINDPYAKRAGSENNSAFYVPKEREISLATKMTEFDRLPLSKLIIYELSINDFVYEYLLDEGKDLKNKFNAVREKLFYLKNLGVNCLKFSSWFNNYNYPEHNRSRLPLNFFAPEYNYGNVGELKQLINECHLNGFAVVLDFPLPYVSPEFGYNALYEDSFEEENPLLTRDVSGVRIDYDKPFAREFIFQVCRFWLEHYKVDGFCFAGDKKFSLISEVEVVKDICLKISAYARQKNVPDFYLCTQRYDKKLLKDLKTNCCFNYDFHLYTKEMCQKRILPVDFCRKLSLSNGKTMINYLENHEHFSILSNLGIKGLDSYKFPRGDRSLAGRTLPYIIALFTADGIPSIYNGQEFGENYYLPQDNEKNFYGEDGLRYKMRPLHWRKYAVDEIGQYLLQFYRQMITLRKSYPALTGNNFHHYFTDTQKKIVVYRRFDENSEIVVAVNFSARMQKIDVPFHRAGVYRDYLDERKREVKVKEKRGERYYLPD